jgi:hypothetical protein
VRAYHRDTPQHAPRPTHAPPTLTLDLITREKKKTGEKLLRIVRYGRAPLSPPAATAAQSWGAWACIWGAWACIVHFSS